MNRTGPPAPQPPEPVVPLAVRPSGRASRATWPAALRKANRIPACPHSAMGRSSVTGDYMDPIALARLLDRTGELAAAFTTP